MVRLRGDEEADELIFEHVAPTFAEYLRDQPAREEGLQQAVNKGCQKPSEIISPLFTGAGSRAPQEECLTPCGSRPS